MAGGGMPPKQQKPNPGADVTPVPDPVPWFGSFLLGIYFFGIAAVTFYLLVATWPVLDEKGGGFAAFSLLGYQFPSVASDFRLFFTVMASGALGSLIHSITSFVDYVGNRRLGRSWIWFLVLRLPVGVALALLFYLVLRGGLIVPTLPGGENAGKDTSHFINPYGIAAISALAGLFSKQATDKLREIFDTLFRTTEPVVRADPLDRTIPIITTTEPTQLVVGAEPMLTVIGHGFQRDCTAAVNGGTRAVQWLSDERLNLTLLAGDVAAAGSLRLVVQNPGSAGGSSNAITVAVAR